MTPIEQTGHTDGTERLYWPDVLRCPQCGGRVKIVENGLAPVFCCRTCTGQYGMTNGIPRLIIPSDVEEIEQFCTRYDELRMREGWASEIPGFYQSLPFRDLSGRHPKEWRWRAKSFHRVQHWLERTFNRRRIQVMDAGAGSGWMSQRLGEWCDVFALDVNAGPHGLAAFPPEQRNFMAVQGDLEHIPLAAGCIDVAIANASLQYTTRLHQCLDEVSRVLRPGGKLIVMDSPTYPTQEAADRAHERTRAYYAHMGLPELAQRYTGLVVSLFADARHFRFHCLRRDLVWSELMKKWIREHLRKPVGARFPIWIGITDDADGKD